VCGCLAAFNFNLGTLIAATTALGSWRLYFTVRFERAVLLLTLLFVSADGTCDFMLIKA